MKRKIFVLALSLSTPLTFFAQSAATGTIGGHDYVDLGLPSGLKWATVNIGAKKPADYGNYYAWGETLVKSSYNSDCKTNNVTLDDFSGNSRYDAATANWNNYWRMPTQSEYKELFDNCTWTAQTLTNSSGQTINGLLVKGPNGNSIFLPAAGYKVGSKVEKAGEKHSYWSSTPHSDDNSKAWLFYSLDNSPFGVGSIRHFGRSVRAVTDGTSVAKSTGSTDDLNLQVVLSAENNIYMPCLTLDEQEMIVTMAVPIPGKNDTQEDFYISRRDEQGNWQPLQPMTALNTSKSEGAPTISADGRWMFFTACSRSDGKGSCDIYFSRRTDYGWTTPINIGEPVNSEYWDSQPCFSADGKTLYFVSNRPDGYGSEDIYQATLIGFDTNGIPVFDNVRNLGDIINTSGSDCAPFIHPDGQTLYFSSYGLSGGIGKFDIYYSRLDSNGKWQKPVNVGAPINTPENDKFLVIGASGTTAYYAAYRPQPDGTTRSEILSFNMPQSARPKPVSYIRGSVYDAQTNKPLEADIELISLADGERQATVKSSASDGSFLIKLPSGCNYALYSSRDGYLFYSQNFELTQTESSAPVVMKVPMSPLITGEKVALRNVFFDTNSTELRQESHIELDRLFDIMQHNTTLRIEIGGHTDNVGSAEYNKKLSQNRAQSAVNYLISKGLDPKRIVAKGYGLTQPVADNKTEEGRALNRRIDAKIIDSNYNSPAASNGNSSNMINGHEYVDLGLSVKWATCNIGASSPSDYDYHFFAWGETRPKSSYRGDNCSTKGKEIGSIKGNISYDAARANWGSTWRLPTISECNELESCEWIETTINGHKGYRIIGKNGNSIFLPTTGLRTDESLNYESSHGGYMTAEEFGTNSCWDLFFNIGNNKGVGNGLKEIGRCVRPVSE